MSICPALFSTRKTSSVLTVESTVYVISLFEPFDESLSFNSLIIVSPLIEIIYLIDIPEIARNAGTVKSPFSSVTANEPPNVTSASLTPSMLL